MTIEQFIVVVIGLGTLIFLAVLLAIEGARALRQMQDSAFAEGLDQALRQKDGRE